MATLIVSSVVSWATGSQLLGAVAGTLVGMAMTPDMPDTQGPRVTDLTVQGSTEGAPIPKVYGRSRIAGNIIWSTGLNETTHSQEVGGKGGGGQTHTTYTYDASFAIGLCESEIVGIGRIWADGNLIYNDTNLSTDEEVTVSEELAITVYTGSETQEVDPLIEADQGVGNTSANRGLAYVVFDQLQLADYGNRIPNLTFEIVTSGTLTNVIEYIHEWTTPLVVTENVLFADLEYVYSMDFLTSPSYRIQKRTYMHDGTLVSTEYDTFDGWRDIAYIVNVEFSYFYKTTSGSNVYTRNTGGSITVSGDTPVIISAYQYGDKLYISSKPVVSLNNNIRRISVYDADSLALQKTVNIGVDNTYRNHYLTVDNATGYVYVDNKQEKIQKYSAALDFIEEWNWLTAPELQPTKGEIPNSAACGPKFGVNDEKIVCASTGSSEYQFGGFGSDGNTYRIDGILTADGLTRFIYFIKNTKMASSHGTIKWKNELNINVVGIAEIIEDICNNSSILPIDLFTSSITDTVSGYTRTHPMTARTAIEPLLTAYHIYATETDYLLKFYKKDGIVNETILEDQLAASTSNVLDKITITRREDLQMPRRLEITYTDQDGDYQPGNQFAQRIIT